FTQEIGIMEANLTSHPITEINDGKYGFGTVDFIDVDNIDMDEFADEQVQAQCEKADFEYIKTAVDYAQNGAAKAIATTPINKESLKAAEVPHIGHTEMLEDLTNTEDPLTMFEVNNMRIFFLTRHLSLKDAI